MAIRATMKAVTKPGIEADIEASKKVTAAAFVNIVEGEESASRVEEIGPELFINSFETTAGKKVVYIKNSSSVSKYVKQHGDTFIEDTSGDFTAPSIEIPPLESKTLFI